MLISNTVRTDKRLPLRFVNQVFVRDFLFYSLGIYMAFPTAQNLTSLDRLILWVRACTESPCSRNF